MQLPSGVCIRTDVLTRECQYALRFANDAEICELLLDNGAHPSHCNMYDPVGPCQDYDAANPPAL